MKEALLAPKRFHYLLPGAITIAAINKNRTINHLGPLCTNDLVQLSLPERILQIDDLRYVYSNGCKMQCFGQYKSDTTRRTTNGRYIRMLLQNVVPPQPQLPESFLNHGQINESPSMSESLLVPFHVSIGNETANTVNTKELRSIATE